MPLSTISAANSGAVFSKALFTDSMMFPIGSDKASATFLSDRISSLGTPFTKSLPLTSYFTPVDFSGLLATPIVFFILSAATSGASIDDAARGVTLVAAAALL